MSVPDGIRVSIRERLWSKADELGWISLGAADKSRLYENWTQDPDIGGQLAHFLDSGQIRVYIKDSLLKDYGHARMSDPRRPFRALGLDEDLEIQREFIKPHGRLLADGRLICWGRADDWKNVLMALHERAFDGGWRPYGAAFLFSAGRFHELSARRAANDAGEKLGVERVCWLD